MGWAWGRAWPCPGAQSPQHHGRKVILARAGSTASFWKHRKAPRSLSCPRTWLSGFWPHHCKISSPIFAPVCDPSSAQDMNGKCLKAWQGLQDGRGCPSSANPPLGPSKYLGGFARGDGPAGRGSVPCPPARHAHRLPAAEAALEEASWCPLPRPALPWLPGANRHPPDSIDFPPKDGGENCLNYNSSTLHFSIIS